MLGQKAEHLVASCREMHALEVTAAQISFDKRLEHCEKLSLVDDTVDKLHGLFGLCFRPIILICHLLVLVSLDQSLTRLFRYVKSDAFGYFGASLLRFSETASDEFHSPFRHLAQSALPCLSFLVPRRTRV